MFLSGSCEDPASLAGSKLLPGSDFVTISSSRLSVQSYTMYGDSVPSNLPSVSYLGRIYDPYFGTTTCEFVSQLRLASAWDEGKFYVDSVKLVLNLLSVKGDALDRHYLKMSEIADVIYTDATYYSNQEVPLTGYSIPDIVLPPLTADTVNSIELDVDTAFGSYLMRNPDMLFHRSDTADFRSYFRGLYFQLISPDDPLFLALSVAAPSGYYKNFFEVYGKNINSENRVITFLLDALTTNASFNLYRHDHTTAEPGKKIEHINDPGYLDTLSYAQTFNGLFTKLLLTDLDSIKNLLDDQDTSIIVNKARLKIPVVYDNDIFRRSTIPSPLYLRYRTTTGKRHYVPETSTAFYNGTADTTATFQNDDVYTLNIATFIQNYLDTDTILPELELFLHPAAGNNLIMRANGSYKPIKFEFVYTKIFRTKISKFVP